MSDREKVIDAFRNCITEPKCRDCPWDECDTLSNGRVEIPKDLALEVMKLLVAQEKVRPNEIYLGTSFMGYQCPACLNEISSKYNYCAYCGRAVKWDG